MNLRADIEMIISKDVEDVINTPLILTLLRVYSLLYLNGQQPRACGQCQRGYYSEIKSNGLLKYSQMEANLNRTCELITTDILYISPMHQHLSNVNITDEIALKCLKNGWLKPESFKTLPANYKVVTHADILDVPSKPLKNKKAE